MSAGTDSSYTEPTSYIPVPVTFDGTNDYLTRGAALTGEADGKNVILAFWIKRNGNAGAKQNVFGNYNGYITSTLIIPLTCYSTIPAGLRLPIYILPLSLSITIGIILWPPLMEQLSTYIWMVLVP